MKRGYLSEYFQGVAVKTLSRVDATRRSNQHEIGTTAEMRHFLGEQDARFDVRYLWLGGEQDSLSDDGVASHYDTRRKNPNRSPEWRLYYPANPVTDLMTEGDTLFLVMRRENTLMFIVTPARSTIQNQLLWLFGFDSQPELGFDAHEVTGHRDAELDFAARLVLDDLGIEYEDPAANTLDSVIERFGMTFPTTRAMSDLARLTLPAVNAKDDADSALIAWLTHEEALFRRLERKIVSERLVEGFGSGPRADVDGFIKYSLQVQNRRKSRRGRSFENHLAAVFRQNEIEFAWQGVTEHGNTVDFLFPGTEAYHDSDWPPARLAMLAAKSTCKDRWRQVLPEAERIAAKHLATLEPAISVGQTTQMAVHGLTLVVPLEVQKSYRPEQIASLLSVSDFIRHVRAIAE